MPHHQANPQALDKPPLIFCKERNPKPQAGPTSARPRTAANTSLKQESNASASASASYRKPQVQRGGRLLGGPYAAFVA